jgi:hypothetical protein
VAADLIELYPYIAPKAGSAPKPSVLQCLLLVAHEFCDRTEIWREWIEDINIVADRASYNLSPDTPGLIKRIVQYKIEGAVRRLADVSLENNEDLVFYTEHVPTTAITDGMDVQVVVVPRFEGASLPQWVFDRYWAVLVCGVLRDLFGQSQRPWADPAGAERESQKFESGVRKAMLDTAHLRNVGRLGGV